jgi:hypothetical protein
MFVLIGFPDPSLGYACTPEKVSVALPLFFARTVNVRMVPVPVMPPSSVVPPLKCISPESSEMEVSSVHKLKSDRCLLMLIIFPTASQLIWGSARTRLLVKDYFMPQ